MTCTGLAAGAAAVVDVAGVPSDEAQPASSAAAAKLARVERTNRVGRVGWVCGIKIDLFLKRKRWRVGACHGVDGCAEVADHRYGG